MTMPRRTKPRPPRSTLLNAAITAQVVSDIWLIAAIALGLEMRIGIAALVAMAISGFWVAFVRQQILIDKIRPTDVQKDDPANWEVGEV